MLKLGLSTYEAGVVAKAGTFDRQIYGLLLVAKVGSVV